MKNANLHKAKKEKNDEFYTQLSDIEKEMLHYKDHFKDKVIFCNCDDPKESNFYKHFFLKFEFYGLKKLITTHYTGYNQNVQFDDVDQSYALIYDGKTESKIPLTGDGDFRSEESLQYLKESDIVVTNPPFSLFREFINTIVDHNKKFLVIGNNNAITYKDIFKLIKDNKLWLGYSNNKTMMFELPERYTKWDYINDKGKKVGKVPAISWYTNLTHKKRNVFLDSYKQYNEKEFPKYDNYDAIEVSKVVDIPENYDGAMGVPITFLDKFNPEQFELLGCSYAYGEPVGYHKEGHGFNVSIDNKEIYKRLFIKRKG